MFEGSNLSKWAHCVGLGAICVELITGYAGIIGAAFVGLILADSAWGLVLQVVGDD